jgi:hypothetical protein
MIQQNKEDNQMKRNVLGILAVTSLLVLAGCQPTNTSTASGDTGKTSTTDGGSAAAEKNDGKVLNIHCWNNEFERRFENYYPSVKKVSDNTYTIPSKSQDGYVTTVKFLITPNDGNAYQNALDAALQKASAAQNEKVDMFLMEADYALKYANSDYSLDVKDIGLTDKDLSDMYDYTKVIATDTRAGKNNALKGVSWQATPGLYAYRNDIAKNLWSDYPADPVATDSAAVKAQKTKAQADFVQAKLSDWTKFDAVAAEAKAKGYYMLSGYDDSYRTFSNNAASSWVKEYKDVDGVKTSVVTLDPMIKKWIKQTKDYTDKGYSHKTSLWDGDWAKDQGPQGKVFGFFYSTWGINFTLLGNSLATPTDKGGKEELGNGLYGQYRVCKGPASYYWGGTWLVGAKDTDQKPEIADIMRKLCCDKAIDKKITVDTQDYTNNKSAMHELATDKDFGSSFLGGQNHIALFEESAKSIKMAAMSPIDQTCNEGIQNAMKDYFAGTITYEKAIQNFKDTVVAKNPATIFDDTFAAAL